MFALASTLTLENGAAFLTLTALEIVLGIDNVIFLSILAAKLEPALQPRARRIGLIAAMVMRILLLLSINWVIGLKATLFSLWGHDFTGKGLILMLGGGFLIAKATFEIHEKLEGPAPTRDGAARKAASFASVIFQVMLIDIVFSLDSVITAVGMSRDINIMIAAVVVSVVVMMLFAGFIARVVERHPTLKMLALAFLILIGVLLVAEAFDQHINRGYIYFAMAFSLAVELLNIRVRSNHSPVALHGPKVPTP